MPTIKVNKLADEIAKAMDNYVEATDDIVWKSCKSVSEATVEVLKRTSPRQPRGGEYAASWTTTKPKSYVNKKHKTTATVFNEEHYRLTHLLEYGHAKVNGGRTRAIPHIKQAEEMAAERYIEEIKRGMEK